MEFKIRLKRTKTEPKKDMSSLRNPEVARLHDHVIQESLSRTDRPESAVDQWNRLTKSMKSAQRVLPSKPPTNYRKWETSRTTLDLVNNRKTNWIKLDAQQQKCLNKKISRSARNDYRDYVENILDDIEKESSAGNMTNIVRLSKRLSSRQKGNLSIQPETDSSENIITSSEEQLE